MLNLASNIFDHRVVDMATSASGCLANTCFNKLVSRARRTFNVGALVALTLSCLSLSSGSEAAEKKPPAHLKDYVSCQFTQAEEEAFKNQETTRLAKSKTAAQAELQGYPPKQKGVKKAKEAVEKAESESSLKAAITAIPDEAMRVQVQASVDAAANKVEPGPEFETPNDLLCSRSLLGWQETADIFGRRIANTYLAVQVVVRNLNQDSDYLIQDVILAAPNTKFGSGRDKLLARGVGIVGQSQDPRNMVMSALDTLAATSGAIALIGTQGAMVSSNFMNLQNANNVLTAFIPPLKRWFPDFTVDQLNRLNDLAFSASTTYKMLVPKGGSSPFVTFVAQKLFADPVHKWSPAEFVWHENNTYVLVAGVHIQEVPGPAIGSLNPTSGPPGTSLTINGTNFGSSQGTSGSVNIGQDTAVITSWSPSAIVATVPNTTPIGQAPVVVSAGGKASAPVNFTVTCAATGPCISNVSPPSQVPGQTVTISGTNFGTTAGSVKFGGTPSPNVSPWADKTITATVPNIAAGPANVVVTVGSADSPAFTFTVNCPAAAVPCITKLSATTLAGANKAGGTITITGQNFGDSVGSVTFGTTAASAIDQSNWSPKQIKVAVPQTLQNGAQNVVVITAGGVAKSFEANFTVP